MGNDEIIVFNSILLQLVAIGALDGLTVDLWELSRDFGRFTSNIEDKHERAKEKYANDEPGNYIANKVIERSVVAVFPDDVSWFRCRFEFHLLTDELHVSLQLGGEILGIFLLESDEGCRGSGQ